MGGFYFYMSKKISLIDCVHCIDWDDKDRFFQSCPRCKGEGKIPNPKELLCNLCGECMCPIGTMNETHPHGLYEAKVTGGYDSYHLFDLNTYIFSFCEKCLRQLFVQCKIKPTVYDTNISSGDLEGEFTWEADQGGYEERLWQDSDAPHQAYLAKKCNQQKDCPNDAVYSIFYDWEDQGGLKFTEGTTCEKHKPTWPSSSAIMKPYVGDKLKPFL